MSTIMTYLFTSDQEKKDRKRVRNQKRVRRSQTPDAKAHIAQAIAQDEQTQRNIDALTKENDE
jgi:hypothetical protein